MPDAPISPSDRPYLGRGWSFPPTFAPAVGVLMTTDEDDILASLQILQTTTLGERIMVPEYGCNLDELSFATIDTRTRTLVTDMIRAAILYHEPRINLESVQIEEDPEYTQGGQLRVGVTFKVKSSNSRFNFVFPFYRDEGTDINLTTTVRLLPEKP